MFNSPRKRSTRFILIEDQSLATSYRQNSFVGYLTALPSSRLTRPILNQFFPWQNSSSNLALPSLSLCTIEAILCNHGISSGQVIIPDPARVLKHEFPFYPTDIILVSTMDPLGLGPATSSWQYLQRAPPFHAQTFWELYRSLKISQQQTKFKIIIGGPGAWQLSRFQEKQLLHAEILFIGEAENDLPIIINKLLSDSTESLKITKNRIVNANYVPESSFLPLKRVSNLHMIEISRGCGRMCQFCSPTLSGKIRFVPESIVLQSARTFLEKNVTSICIQSEDTLRYGSTNFEINTETLLHLYQELFNLGMQRIFLTHATLAHYSSQPDAIEKLTNLLHAHGHRYYPVQPGIETGSERLMRSMMGGKYLPQNDAEWHEIVLSAFKVMQQNKWVPISSVVIGLPDERREDLQATEDLIDSLIQHEFFFLFAPLLFVPVPKTPLEKGERPKLQTLTVDQSRVLKKMWKFNTRTFTDVWNLPNISGYQFPDIKAGFLRGIMHIAGKFF